MLVLSTEHNVDDRPLEESVYLYIAHKVESLYRFVFFVVVAGKMLHTFTPVYLRVVLAFLHACSSNTRPVSTLVFFSFKANCCFSQCLPPVYLQSEYTLSCMQTSTHVYVVSRSSYDSCSYFNRTSSFF